MQAWTAQYYILWLLQVKSDCGLKKSKVKMYSEKETWKKNFLIEVDQIPFHLLSPH